MSRIVSIRLTLSELQKLDEMVSSGTGCESRGEFIRLLLHRESNRRKGLKKPFSGDYQTAFRTGRPKKILPMVHRPTHGKSDVASLAATSVEPLVFHHSMSS